MASGTAVLAYDVAAARMHVEDGVRGRVVEAEDEEGFVAAAMELARDVEGTRRMGEAARKRAETISWDAVVEGFETVLREEASVGRRELRGARLVEA
jgi:glycosyltransferase involved in cell wall biosynthesis